MEETVLGETPGVFETRKNLKSRRIKSHILIINQ